TDPSRFAGPGRDRYRGEPEYRPETGLPRQHGPGERRQRGLHRPVDRHRRVRRRGAPARLRPREPVTEEPPQLCVQRGGVVQGAADQRFVRRAERAGTVGPPAVGCTRAAVSPGALTNIFRTGHGPLHCSRRATSSRTPAAPCASIPAPARILFTSASSSATAATVATTSRCSAGRSATGWGAGRYRTITSLSSRSTGHPSTRARDPLQGPWDQICPPGVTALTFPHPGHTARRILFVTAPTPPDNPGGPGRQLRGAAPRTPGPADPAPTLQRPGAPRGPPSSPRRRRAPGPGPTGRCGRRPSCSAGRLPGPSPPHTPHRGRGRRWRPRTPRPGRCAPGQDLLGGATSSPRYAATGRGSRLARPARPRPSGRLGIPRAARCRLFLVGVRGEVGVGGRLVDVAEQRIQAGPLLPGGVLAAEALVGPGGGVGVALHQPGVVARLSQGGAQPIHLVQAHLDVVPGGRDELGVALSVLIAVCGAAGDEDAGAAVQHGDVPALRLDSPGAYGGGLRAGADLLKLFGGHFSSSFF